MVQELTLHVSCNKVSEFSRARLTVEVVVVDVRVVETTVVTGAEVIKQEHALLIKLLA